MQPGEKQPGEIQQILIRHISNLILAKRNLARCPTPGLVDLVKLLKIYIFLTHIRNPLHDLLRI